jgi:hypothetical protein
VPNTYGPLVAGSTVVWTVTGSGNKVLTATSLADQAARQGDKSDTLVDVTRGLPVWLEILVETQVQVVPTDGKELECWLGFSSNSVQGTGNPGGLGGADAALANPTSVKAQLTFAGSVIMSNAIGLGVQRQDPFLVRPKDAFVIPVLVNNTGQTISATGNQTKISITPWYQQTS